MKSFISEEALERLIQANRVVGELFPDNDRRVDAKPVMNDSFEFLRVSETSHEAQPQLPDTTNYRQHA